MSPATRRPTSGSAGRRSPPKGGPPMFIGAHCVISSPKPEADRAFFRDVLKLPSIDDGGYVIFGLPPAEVSVQDEGWGVLTEVTLPSGGKLHVYQPRHKHPKPA